MKMKPSLVALATLGALSSMTWAATMTLGDIDVHAKRMVNLNVSKVTQDTMRLNNDATVSDVAKHVSGVYYQVQGGRGETNISVRGLDEKRAPVFIDGIPVYVPYDGNMDMGRFTTYDYSEVVVSKGVASTLYGANSLGGAVNLVTTKPEKPFEAVLGGGYRMGESNHTGQYHGYARLGMRQDMWYAQVSASGLVRDGLQLPHGIANLPGYQQSNGLSYVNTKSRDYRGSVKVGLTPNETDEYVLTFAKQHGFKEDPAYLGKGPEGRFWTWPKWDKTSVYFLGHTELNRSLALNTKLYYDQFINELESWTSAKKDNLQFPVSHYKEHSLGGIVEADWQVSENNRLKGSVSVKEDRHRDKDDGSLPRKMKMRTYSAGLENTWSITPMTNLLVGARYSYRKPLLAEQFADKRSRAIKNFAQGHDTAWDAQATLTHRFTDSDEVQFTLARKSRFPFMKEMYSYRLGKYAINPNLKSEMAYHANAGYKKTWGDKGSTEINVYMMRIRDAINAVQIKEGKETVFQNQNVGTEERYGVELNADYQLFDTLKVGGNYSFIHAKNDQLTTPVTGLPRHKLFGFVEWQALPKLTLYVDQSVESGRWSWTNGSKKKPSQLVKTGGFGVTNTKLIYRITDQIQVDVGVSNLFDKRYMYQEGYYEQGRTFFANFKATF